jgi:diguanylate cyclase (GGDEF)-like protein/PAS domain S-box-containing protein
MAQAASRRRPRRRVLVAPVETDSYRLAFEHAGIGVAVHDPEGAAVSVNAALRELLGREPRDFTALVAMVHRDERAGLDERLRAVVAGDVPTVVCEHRLEHPDGTDRCVRLHVTGALDHAGELVAVVVHAIDVTEQRERARELLHQTLHDSLTGLPNRTLLRDRLDHALSRMARTGQPRVALLYLDLDHFKDVNDSLGHAGGDVALVEAANRLRGAVRPSDTVARFGGDEFVVCCEDISHADEAVNMAQRILAAMRAPFHPDSDELRLATSIGIAFARHPGTTADELLREADRALYTAKRAGRDRYAVHFPTPT